MFNAVVHMSLRAKIGLRIFIVKLSIGLALDFTE